MHKLITLTSMNIYLTGIVPAYYLFRLSQLLMYDKKEIRDYRWIISAAVLSFTSWFGAATGLLMSFILLLCRIPEIKRKPPRWLAILPVIFLASCTDEREYQRMKTVEEVVDSLNNNYPKEDNRYDSSLHIVIAGMKQEATLMHLENDTWYVSTQIWTGSKTKMYTLEDNIVHFVPKHKVKSTLRTDSIAAQKRIYKINVKLKQHPIYN